jgi:hypothetical protein
MSAPEKRLSRISRGSPPQGKLTENNYRDRAREPLRRDFNDRCAYSQRHTLYSGLRCMEIDHFDPTLKGAARHKYRNLMWSTRLCNNAKLRYWPSLADRRKGIRFLNPCKEWDYGLCIFENPITHELIGKTPAARYHIEILRLNDESFIFERSLRTTLSELFKNPKVSLEGSFKEIQKRIKAEREKLEILIPPIPYELVLQSV